MADHVVGARLTVSDRAHSPTGPVSRGLREGTVSSVSTSVWEKTARDAGQLCSSPCIAGAFPSAAHAVELRGSGSEQIRAWALEEELPGTPEALCLLRPQSLMVFAARSYGTSLPGPGTPGWGSGVGLGLLAPKISPWNFYLPHVGEGSAHSVSAPHPSTVWMDVVSLIP